MTVRTGLGRRTPLRASCRSMRESYIAERSTSVQCPTSSVAQYLGRSQLAKVVNDIGRSSEQVVDRLVRERF
jgi:hypothetical protein